MIRLMAVASACALALVTWRFVRAWNEAWGIDAMDYTRMMSRTYDIDEG